MVIMENTILWNTLKQFKHRFLFLILLLFVIYNCDGNKPWTAFTILCYKFQVVYIICQYIFINIKGVASVGETRCYFTQTSPIIYLFFRTDNNRFYWMSQGSEPSTNDDDCDAVTLDVRTGGVAFVEFFVISPHSYRTIAFIFWNK